MASPDTDHRGLYAGLIRLHVLHHAVKEAVYGFAMIAELRRHGYELLNETLFYDLDHARCAVARWTAAYNQERPHSALGYLSPAAYAAYLTATGYRRACANLNQ